MRMMFWWRQPVGYFDAGTRALARAGHEVAVAYEAPSAQAPFSGLMNRGFSHLADVAFWSSRPPTRMLRAMLRRFEPDVLVISSWGFPEMIWAAAKAPDHTVRLTAADTPWRASAKQLAGQFTHRKVLTRALDGAWVAGPPQRAMLQHLGFQTWQIIENVNCCDTGLFARRRPWADRLDGPFLFVGRQVPNKGIVELVEAFGRFRKSTGSQRRLLVVGSGPVEVRGEGIDVLPFVDPPRMRDVMDEAFALVHPAQIEHWGVVVHEAAAMGLPLILSPYTHAGSRFLWPDVNGLCAGPHVPELARALEELDRVDLKRYEAMSHASERLGALLDLDTWVDTLECGVARIRRATDNDARSGTGISPSGN